MDKAVFLYSGLGNTVMFTVDEIINKTIDITLNKDMLQLIGDAFHPKNLKYFVEDLLKRLESNNIYVN